MTTTTGTPAKKEEFLQELLKTGIVTKTAEVIGIPPRTVYNWRKVDKEFAAAWDEAVETSTDRLVEEARRRAHDGTLKPVYQGGKHVGDIREYSDTLLMFLIKARRPEYRERASLEVMARQSVIFEINLTLPEKKPAVDVTPTETAPELPEPEPTEYPPTLF